jgi:prephenate dehydrogenase
MQTHIFNKVLVVGIGLIGASFALALKKAGVVGQVQAWDRCVENLTLAKKLGVIDHIPATLAEAVQEASLIILAAPVAQTASILQSISPYLSKQTVISDMGSTKTDVCKAAYQVLAEKVGQFIPAHPIAGREQNGAQAGLADLFVNKKVVLTPLPENRHEDVMRLEQAWQACGAQIHHLSAQEHDEIFASVSHLPHVLAYALVDDIANKPNAERLFQYAASGFRDFTRIAGSSPEMWRDICQANRLALLDELNSYTLQLQKIKTYLESESYSELSVIFNNAQKARHEWSAAIELAEQARLGGGD